MTHPSGDAASARRRAIGLAIFAAAAFGATMLAPRIRQDPAYHRFADGRAFLGVPNFNDVVSNAPFIVVGWIGLLAVRRGGRARFVDDRERAAWRVVFIGVALTGAGSAYYHLDPTTQSLAWDRLPMTVVFTGLVSALLSERLGVRAGRRSLAPLVAFGAGTVAYWSWTESQGAGDLRPYGFVQYFPILFVPALWAFFPRRYDRTSDLVVSAGWYTLAKITEAIDGRVYEALGIFSGHTLKHLFAALATACFVRHLVRRAPSIPDRP